MTSRRVGFIGLGNMGGRMTRRLADAGYEVLGYDPVAGKAVAAGAIPADSVADVVTATECVLMSLPDSSVIEPVVLGPAGVLESCRPGQVIVDFSTAAPSSTLRLHASLAERGAQYLDAGISGGAAAAEKGTLTIMVGGAEAALQSVADIFEPIAAKVVYMGASGAGHTTKVLNNFLNAVSLAATAEVMVAARLAGLDLARVLDPRRLPRGRPDQRADDQGHRAVRGLPARARRAEPGGQRPAGRLRPGQQPRLREPDQQQGGGRDRRPGGRRPPVRPGLRRHQDR